LIGFVGILYLARSFTKIKVPENCLLVPFFIHQQKPRSFSVRYVEEVVIFSSLLPWRKWPWRGEGLDLDPINHHNLDKTLAFRRHPI
jgi:hypothetical protein